MSAFLTGFLGGAANMGQLLGKAASGLASSGISAAGSGLVGSIFGRSGYQRKKDAMQLAEFNHHLNDLMYDKALRDTERLTKEERAYQEDLYKRLQSPEAMVRQLEEAGINPGQFFSGGSSPISPMVSPSPVQAPLSHSSGPGGISYQTPQFPGNPLTLAQIEDLRASANLKNAQADNEPIRGALMQQQTELTSLKAAGMPFANELLATNSTLARLTMGDKLDLSSLSVKTSIAQLNKIAADIQALNDKHDLHGIMKQQAINQCALQVASYCAKIAETYLLRANTRVSNAQVEVLKQQAEKYAVDILNGKLDFIKNVPEAAGALRTSSGSQALRNLAGGGVIGAVTGALGGIVDFFTPASVKESGFSDFLESVFGDDFKMEFGE